MEMSLSRRELLIAKICSGLRRIQIGEKTFYIDPPTPFQRLLAQELYEEVYEEAHLEGLLEQREAMGYLWKLKMWGEKEEKLLHDLPREIEDFKVRIFECLVRTKEKEIVREALKKAEKELDRLTSLQNTYWHATVEGAAQIAKSKFLTAVCVRDEGGESVFKDHTDTSLLDSIIRELSTQKISEGEYRELARTEPWRSVWGSKGSEKGVFGVCGSMLTDEQKALMVWSTTYDRVYEHHQCPPDDVISDDDALDGWFITQKRKRGDIQEDQFNLPEKVRNAQEVFIPVNSPQDAARVESLNSPWAKKMKAANMAKLKKKGTLSLMEQVDTKFRIMDEMAAKGL